MVTLAIVVWWLQNFWKASKGPKLSINKISTGGVLLVLGVTLDCRVNQYVTTPRSWTSNYRGFLCVQKVKILSGKAFALACSCIAILRNFHGMIIVGFNISVSWYCHNIVHISVSHLLTETLHLTYCEGSQSNAYSDTTSYHWLLVGYM